MTRRQGQECDSAVCYTGGAISCEESMNHTLRKMLVVGAALVGAVGCGLIGARAQSPAPGGKQAAQQSATHHAAPEDRGGKPKTAAEQFKNIQILKDMPADQLIPAMQFMTASLGVSSAPGFRF